MRGGSWTTEGTILWERVWNDPTVNFLKRILYHSSESLEELSKDDFDILIRPTFRTSTIAAAHLARKFLQLEGDDLVTNARLVSFGHDYFVFSPKGLAQYDKVIVKRAERCLLQDGPPEVCFHCRVGGVLECSSTNPDHIMVVTSSMTDGFRNCEYIIKNVEQVINGPKDYGRKLRDLPPNPASDETRLQLAQEALTYYTNFVLMAYASNYGEAVLYERMRYRMYIEGMKDFLRTKGSSGETDQDPLHRITKILDFLTIRWDVDEEEEGKNIRIGSCPFSSFPPHICHMLEYYFKGICMGDGNDMEFLQVERATEGGEGCRYIFRKIPPDQRKWFDD